MPHTVKLYTTPKISPESFDMSVDWYVWFRFFNAKTNRWEQKRYKKGINEIKTLKERLQFAHQLQKSLQECLDEGWNPFIREEMPVKMYSLKETIEYIQKIKAATSRPKTIRTYKYIMGAFVAWLKEKNLTNANVKEFTSSLAMEYMDTLITRKSYSGRTYNDHLIILRTFFNAIVEREWISVNPFKAVKKKQTTIGRNLAYSEDEKEALRKVLYREDRWMYYLSQIMYYCFIRRTEMIRLKISDIDLINKTIVIRAEVSKNKCQESVVIPRGLEPILKEMRLEHYPEDYYLFGRHLFPSEKKYCNENHVSSRHNKFLPKLNIDSEKGLYSWKHTGACAAYYATNKDIYSLMRQLRHRDLNTTMIYLKSLGLIQNEAFRNSMVA